MTTAAGTLPLPPRITAFGPRGWVKIEGVQRMVFRQPRHECCTHDTI